MPRHCNIALAVLIFQALVFGQTPSSTTIAATPSASNYGQAVTLTATVTAGATGKVTFYDGVTILGVGTLSGTQASITTVMLASGNRKLRAYYQGDGTYAGSSSASLLQSVVAGASMGFNCPVSYPGTWVSAIAVGDFNGDHKQDLVVANSTTRTVTVYLGNGDGTFQAGISSPTRNYPATLAVGDFNGDGRMDLAIPEGILLGNGDGTFQPVINSPPLYLGSIAVADFNGDGKADLVTSGVGPAVLMGTAMGPFRHRFTSKM